MRVKERKAADGTSLADLKAKIDLRDVIELTDAHRGDKYVVGLCPFHENDGKPHKTKSFLVYDDHYMCLSATTCGKRGDIYNWVAFKLFGDPEATRGEHFRQVLEHVRKQYGTDFVPVKHKVTKKAPRLKEAEIVRLAEQYHQYLLTQPKRLAYFFWRGFTLATIKKQLWGWDGENYVITVWSGVPQDSRLKTLRLRSSLKDPVLRYSGLRGANEQMLYNREALLWAIRHKAPALLIFYGELDAGLAWQDGLPAVSNTNGALAFKPEWLARFKGAKVFVPDKGEEKAALNDANAFDRDGWVVHLPHGKFKDYTEARQAGMKPLELKRLIEKTLGYKILRRT
jgi:hypothetical protein